MIFLEGPSVHISMCTAVLHLLYLSFRWVGVVGLEWVAVMVAVQKRLKSTDIVRQ